MNPRGSVAAVVAAIRDEAAAEAERIEQQAAAELAQLAADVSAEAPSDGPARILAARKAARERLAQEEWAGARSAIEAREAFVQRAAAEGRRLLAAPRPPAERRALLEALAREAISYLPGDRLVLSVAPGDAPLLAGVAFGRAVAVEAAPSVEAGCIARTEDGRITFDNTLAERARRFEAAWRAEVAKVYGA